MSNYDTPDDARLRESVREHLRSVGVPDADAQADDFVTRVRAGRAATPPDNDAVLWAAASWALRESLDVEHRELVARQVIAILRRVREPYRRTWAPGDPLPSPPPEKMLDLDGFAWVHQPAGNGCYRMNSRGRRALGGASVYEGVWVWPDLLVAEGPFTEAGR